MALHVLSGVVVEYCSRKRSFPAPRLGCMMGVYNLAFWYIEPIVWAMITEGRLGVQRKEFMRMPLDDGKGFFFGISTGLAWPIYFVFSTIHYSAYFNLIGTAGLVTTTAQKSLVPAGYVALSAFAFAPTLFCNADGTKATEYCLSHKWLIGENGAHRSQFHLSCKGLWFELWRVL